MTTATQMYFALFDPIDEARRARDYDLTIKLCYDAIAKLPSVVAAFTEADGFPIDSIPPIELLRKLLTVRLDRKALATIASDLANISELESWLDDLQISINECDDMLRVYEVIRAEPGVEQRRLWKRLGLEDPWFGSLLREADHMGYVRREKHKWTYLLYPTEKMPH